MLGNRLIHDLEESPMRTPKTILMSVWLHVQKHGKQGGSSWPASIEMQQNVHNQHLKLITVCPKTSLHWSSVMRHTDTYICLFCVHKVSSWLPLFRFQQYAHQFWCLLILWPSDLFSKAHEMFLELKTHVQVFKLLTLEGQSHLWFGCSTIRLLDRHVLH